MNKWRLNVWSEHTHSWRITHRAAGHSTSRGSFTELKRPLRDLHQPPDSLNTDTGDWRERYTCVCVSHFGLQPPKITHREPSSSERGSPLHHVPIDYRQLINYKLHLIKSLKWVIAALIRKALDSLSLFASNLAAELFIGNIVNDPPVFF